MLISNGEELLRDFSKGAYPYEVYQINDRISHVVGLGHSNSCVIEGDTSVILVDALDTDLRAEKLKILIREKTDKPVRTIIYTHGHPDHRGGAAAFKDTVQEIIMFGPKKPVLKHTDRIDGILAKRTNRQFGYGLSDEECFCQGIGIREGKACGEGNYNFLPPDTVYHEEEVEREIDGVKMKMVSAVGETDDQMFIWLEEDGVICCGDNYFGCFPNLYALRGSQYRDAAAWVDSLEKIMEYGAKALLPGHTKPVLGADNVREVLGNYKDAIEYILLNTLDCMNRGMSMSQCAEQVVLPEKYRKLPYLGEFYGAAEWAVKGIYTGYVGWFDGNPANLHPLPDREFSSKLVSMISAEKVLEESREAMENGSFQMALQLCDLLIQAKEEESAANQLKRQALLSLARQETSANGRNYYMMSAKEMDAGDREKNNL